MFHDTSRLWGEAEKIDRFVHGSQPPESKDYMTTLDYLGACTLERKERHHL